MKQQDRMLWMVIHLFGMNIVMYSLIQILEWNWNPLKNGTSIKQ